MSIQNLESAGAADPEFDLTPEQVHDLADEAGDLLREGERCAEAGCWRAAVVMVAAAVETCLLGTVYCCRSELRAAGLWPTGDPTRWSLYKLLTITREADWLPTTLGDREGDLFAPLKGEVGDAVTFVQQIRNMATHPGVYIRESLRPDFADPEHMRPTYDIFCGIADQVFDRLTPVVGSR